MAKKGHRKGHKGRKRSVVKNFKSKAEKIVRGNKRPLKLLRWARDRMKQNLPKLERIIEQREGRGER